MPIYPSHSDSGTPTAKFLFSIFSRMTPSAAGYHLYADGCIWIFSHLEVRDCAFFGGTSVLGGSSDITTTVENNLFERSTLACDDSLLLTLHNNLFKNCSIGFDSWGDNAWIIKDNAFDNCSITADWITPYDHGHNAYINTTRIDSAITNDIVLTNFNYVPVPLGD